jgi:Transposase DDE domain group 1
MTQCIPTSFAFQDLGSRDVLADFNGGRITSDAGALLLREVEAKFGLLDQFATCFTDHRDPDRIEHSLVALLKQRIFGLCLGYEDLNDHDRLRHDALMAVLVGVTDPLGEGRTRPADRGKPLAGKSTLNRLELTPVGADDDSRYKKIVAHMHKIENYLPEVFIRQHTTPPDRIVLDLDATDDPIHGQQLGRFFHGYYGDYCYLPLYIFAGDHPLAAILRPSDIDASRGCLPHIERIVKRIRQSWPRVEIVLRGDSGFCRDYLMRWCEANGVEFVFGLAKNKRLLRVVGKEMHEAKELFTQTKQPARVFKDFVYRTQKSWSRQRRVVGKAEHIKGDKANPRFVVTSLSESAFDAKTLYEKQYCARGDMENRIKEQQLYLFADHLCCETMRANQVRLYFSTVAYVVMRALREFGLKETSLECAQCDTIRVQLLKIGAVVRVSVRRVVVSLSEAYPWRELFARVWSNLRQLVLPPRPAAVPTG